MENFGGGTVIFNGKCSLSRGFRLAVGEMGKIEFGADFWANAGLIISASKEINFGHNCLLGWNCFCSDGDGHSVIDCATRKALNYGSPIFIGDHVWIASNVALLKGSKIGNDSVVAYGASISEPFELSNVLIGGLPGKVLKQDITWDYNPPL